MRGDDELIERARRLLDNATPGPWRKARARWDEDNQWSQVYIWPKRNGYEVAMVVVGWSGSTVADRNLARGDAALIAAAPELVSGLLAEVERLLAWKDSAMSVLSEWDNVHDALGRPGQLGASKALASHFEVERLRGELAARSDTESDTCPTCERLKYPNANPWCSDAFHRSGSVGSGEQ